MSTLHVKKVGSGVLLKYGEVSLAFDTGIKGEITLLSHSHSDHIRGLKQARHIIATEATFDTWNARNSESSTDITPVEVGDMFGQIGVNITLLNAGHVLGSTMFYLEFDDGLTALYTGDFNNVDSLVHTAARPLEADVLITEATYGTSSWIFPNRKEVYERILNAASATIDQGRTPVFNAYSLGKSQEAIALLQSGGFRVISGNLSIDKVCKVYKDHGVDLRYHTMRSANVSDALESGAVIVSSSFRHTIDLARHHLEKRSIERLEQKTEGFNLSGWTAGKYAERGFPLSAHSDFEGLLNFAKTVNPRVAYVFTENARPFSKHLSDIGINAVPLE
ncbi:MAG: MBL fold metallo-hydrolase [Candidatus Thorarchaeota archaeon]|nr:MBL fold metallo-hydrolase [Candidatus Thorarchaeota archaeon]